MTAPTDADVERVLAEARWLARGGSAPAANKRVAAALIEAQAENARLREKLMALANAADDVGVAHFDTDSMSPEVERMQAATLDARAVLGARP